MLCSNCAVAPIYKEAQKGIALNQKNTFQTMEDMQLIPIKEQIHQEQ